MTETLGTANQTDNRDSNQPEIDSHQFVPHINSDNWTGATPNFYTHPDHGDRRFSQEEVSALRERDLMKRRADLNRPRTVGRTIQNNVPEGPGNEERWRTLNPRDYIGVNVRTLESIIHSENPTEQQLFGELLSHLDSSMSHMFSKALTGGKLSADERQFLTFGLHEFSKWMPRAEAVAAKINAADVELAAKRNAELGTDTLLRGPQRIADVFKREVLKVAMRDQNRFQELEAAYGALNNDRSTLRFKEWDARVRGLCKDVGIQTKDYDAVFNLSRGNRAESRKIVREQVQKDMSSFGKAVDFALNTVGLSKTDRVMKRADKIDLKQQKFWGSPTSWVVDRIDENLAAITEVMAQTISGNPEVQHALEQEAFNKKDIILAEDSGSKNRTEAGATAAHLNSSDKAVERYNLARAVAKNAQGQSYNEWTPAERTQFRDNWNPIQGVKEEKASGFWALAVQSFVRALWNKPEQRNKLSTDDIN